MSRKEVYATTGTRLLVRVFAGFDFVADDIQLTFRTPAGSLRRFFEHNFC